MEFVLRRAFAFLFDCALLFIVLWPAGLLIQKLLGIRPDSGLEVWYTLLVNFSLPVWAYFALSDASKRGATVGKRRQRMSVSNIITGERIGRGRALVRTALKLLPWELIHISAFVLSSDINEFGTRQIIGVTIANGLFIGFCVVAIVTGGRRSIHDFVVGTVVAREA